MRSLYLSEVSFNWCVDGDGIVGIISAFAIGGFFLMLEILRRRNQAKIHKSSIYENIEKIKDSVTQIHRFGKGIDVGDEEKILNVYGYLLKNHSYLQLLYSNTLSEFRLVKNNQEYSLQIQKLLDCTLWIITDFFNVDEDKEVICKGIDEKWNEFKIRYEEINEIFNDIENRF